MTIDQLDAQIGRLDELWPLLSVSASSARGIGQPSHKSRPPATLSAVALAMEISAATAETVRELTQTFTREPMRNLRRIAAALRGRPNADLISWWSEAVADWVKRARELLGYQPILPHQQYGAACPNCHATVAVVREAGESWNVPAIGMTWTEQEFESWVIHSVYCRNCGIDWTRGVDLDRLLDLLATMQSEQSLSIPTQV